MKLLFSLCFLIGSLSLAAESELNCRLQMFYPKDGCGNCSAVDRKFTLSKGQQQESFETNNLSDSPRARDKRVSYSIIKDGHMVHYSINILDLKTGYKSSSNVVYQLVSNGVFANLGDNTGLSVTLACPKP